MILVTGGTGLVGSHLLYFLLKDGASVRAIHRKKSNLIHVKKVFGNYTKDVDTLYNKIDWVEANLTDIPALTDAFKNVTYVYHAAAYISFNPDHYYKLKKSNIEGTANIVNLCLANDIKKLCYVSSVATFGRAVNGNSVDETTQWNPEEKNNVYSITKYGAEMEVWRGTQEGLDAIIVNPSIIIGEGFWNSGSGALIKNAIKGAAYYPKGASGFVDVQDVTKAMIQLMGSSIKNQQYILSGKNISYKEFFDVFAAGAGVSSPKKIISKGMLLFLSKLDWLSSSVFGTKRRLLKPIVIAMFEKTTYNASKIENKLPFSFTPFHETVSRIVCNYKGKG